jgi:hypothetical protein
VSPVQFEICWHDGPTAENKPTGAKPPISRFRVMGLVAQAARRVQRSLNLLWTLARSVLPSSEGTPRRIARHPITRSSSGQGASSLRTFRQTTSSPRWWPAPLAKVSTHQSEVCVSISDPWHTRVHACF